MRERSKRALDVAALLWLTAVGLFVSLSLLLIILALFV